MNVRQAKDVASRICAFDDGAFVTLPSNIEIRDLIGFLRSVIPVDKFDRLLVSDVQAQPLRFDASFADRIRSQFNIANEIVEGDHKLKQKLLREVVTCPPSKPQESETFVVLATFGYGLILIISLWRLWQLGGNWQWVAVLIAALIAVAMIAANRKRAKSNGTSLGSFEFSDDSSLDPTLSGDCGGGPGD